MAAVETAINTPPSIALPGLGRALVVAGKLGQKAAEDIFQNLSVKALAGESRFDV